MSQAETSDRDAAPEAVLERAIGLQKARRYEAAVALYRELARGPLTLNVATGLGVCLAELGQFAEAEHWLLVAARARPTEPYLRRHLGNLYALGGRVEHAELELRTALAFAPGNPAAQTDLGGLLLSLGRYAEGWPLIEARAELSPDTVPPVRLSFPEWKGEPLTGKSILVCYEQGLGDQIQMCRFARTLKERGAAHVTLACRSPLAALLATAPGVDEVLVVDMNENVPVKRHDYWSRYFSLPHPLGITLETLPTAPYLSAPADRRARWADYDLGEKRIGFVWRASPTGFNARNKNLPDELARRVLDLGAVSLHPEDTGVTDFADTAALMERLDLVVSIDTSVAHLAGAMGKPCWTLLPFLHCDWRWLRGRTDSPWYPSMRLYRQPRPGEWTSVIDRVCADLAARG